MEDGAAPTSSESGAAVQSNCAGPPFGFATRFDFDVDRKGRELKHLFESGTGVLQLRRYTTESIALIDDPPKRVKPGALDWRVVLCTLCDEEIKAGANEGTSNVLTHPRKKHPPQLQELQDAAQEAKKRQLDVRNLIKQENAMKATWTTRQKQLFDNLLADFFAVNALSFNTADSEEFRRLMHYATRGLDPPGRKAVAASTVAAGNAVKQRVAQELARCHGYALISDGYTGADHMGYFLVAAATVDENFNRRVYVLDLHQMPPSHKAVELAKFLEHSAREYGLKPERLVAAVGDSASTQLKAMAEFTMAFADRRVASPCAVHILQTSIREPLGFNKALVSAPMKVLRTMIDNCLAVVAYFNASASASKALRDQCGKPPYSLISSSATRWDSLPIMLSRLLKLKLQVLDVLKTLVGDKNKNAAKALEKMHAFCAVEAGMSDIYP